MPRFASRIPSAASFAVPVLALALACKGGDGAGSSASAQPLSYDGSTVVSSLILPEALPAFEKKTGVKFGKIGTSGAGKGLNAALAGEVDVAGVTRSLKESELAKKPYYQIIGYDALGIWVNEANPVRSLTKAQIKAIYTGEVKNWKKVGGKDLPIVPCTEKLDSAKATLETVKAVALDGVAYGPVREMQEFEQCLEFAAKEPGVITAATFAASAPTVRPLVVDGIALAPENVRSGAYLLSRPILLVTRSVPSGGLKQFFEFMLSPDGQAVVGKKFISIR